MVKIILISSDLLKSKVKVNLPPQKKEEHLFQTTIDMHIKNSHKSSGWSFADCIGCCSVLSAATKLRWLALCAFIIIIYFENFNFSRYARIGFLTGQTTKFQWQRSLVDHYSSGRVSIRVIDYSTHEWTARQLSIHVYWSHWSEIFPDALPCPNQQPSTEETLDSVSLFSGSWISASVIS